MNKILLIAILFLIFPAIAEEEITTKNNSNWLWGINATYFNVPDSKPNDYLPFGELSYRNGRLTIIGKSNLVANMIQPSFRAIKMQNSGVDIQIYGGVYCNFVHAGIYYGTSIEYSHVLWKVYEFYASAGPAIIDDHNDYEHPMLSVTLGFRKSF